MKQNRIKQDYDKTAGIYDSRYKAIQEEKYRIMLTDLVLNGPILDHGCGTGLLKEFLGKKLFGIDISLNMLKKADESAVQGDLEKIPFKNNSFATILSFTAIQNINNIENGLNELKRIIKKSGLIVLTVLNKFDIKAQIEKYFDIQEIRLCGEDIGFILNPNK